MTAIITRDRIESAIAGIDLIKAMEDAFVRYSRGEAVVPPVGELLFEDPPGEAHIKYGFLKSDDIFVIKVATGFYDNPAHDLPSNSGLMLVFDKRTGAPKSVLLDEGHLTNLRTAAAGAVAAKYLARPDSRQVCVLGSGVQARLQVEMISRVLAARDVAIWARRSSEASRLAAELVPLGWNARLYNTPQAAAADADIVITATAATEPLIALGDIRPGTHITAMGSDTPDKQELAPDIILGADVIVADSLSQCMSRGEIHHALAMGYCVNGAVELGDVIAGKAEGRSGPGQITVADLTGVAVQDIAIAKAVLQGSDG